MTFYRALASLMSAGNTKVNQPGTPTIGTAFDNNSGGGATVPFTAGTGSATSFTVTSTPGSFTNSGASSPITVTGMSIDSSYTFNVFASNTFGQSQPSAASNSVTIVPSVTSFGYMILGNATNVTNKFNMTLETNAASTNLPITANTEGVNGGQKTAVAGYVSISTATVYKQAYSNDAFSTLASNTPNSAKSAGVNSTNLDYYTIGGEYVASASKMPFTTETFASLASSMSTPRGRAFSGNNGTTAGYVLAGNSIDGNNYNSNGSKIPFSTDTFATISAPGNKISYGIGSLINPNVSMISIAGYNVDAFGRTNTFRKMPFSTETQSSTGQTTPATTASVASFSGSANGYSFPGDANAGNYIQRYVFSNDTNSTIAATLTVASRRPLTAYANTP